MAALFRRFPLAMQTVYSDLKQRALEQASLLVGTPGSVSERTQDGRAYLFRQFYDAEGAKGADHLGPSDDPAAIAKAEEMRARITEANALLEDAQLLGRAGYARCDASAGAVLVACANAGLFRAGAVLVGSHALGALLNDLGARVAALATEAVDIARRERLDLGKGVTISFEDVLLASRIPFQAVPSLDRKGHPTSYRRRPGKGAQRMRVDLIAPAPGKEIVTISAPEIAAHAVGLPYMRYVLADPLDTVVIGRSSVVPVKAPRPERFAWHKMAVSELRHLTSDKKNKDIEQASVMFAVLAEHDPEALVQARKQVPTSLVNKVRRAASAVEARLVKGKHERALELLRELV